MKVAILFQRFGPYHMARLAATNSMGDAVGIEVSDTDSRYGWAFVSRGSLRIRTALPGADPANVSIRRVIRCVEAALEQEAPGSVAIPGWKSPAALAALRWCVRRGRPAVLMAESAAEDMRRFAVAEWIKRRIVRLFRGALVGGSRHRRYVERLGVDSSLVWDGYDVVDNEYFERQARHVRENADSERARMRLPGRYWLASCRLIRKKNLLTLLEGYSRYRRARSAAAWDLVLVGDGPLRPALENEIQRLGVKGHVVMPGFRQYEELPVYYALAEAFIHASTVEQWGLVVNEAVASGLAVLVSSRCGCVPELVRDGYNGWTFDPADVSQMVDLMVRMHDMGRERAILGRRGQSMLADWGPERFGRNLWAAVHASASRPAPQLSLLDAAIIRGVMHA